MGLVILILRFASTSQTDVGTSYMANTERKNLQCNLKSAGGKSPV
jgi:hypothetical protein